MAALRCRKLPEGAVVKPTVRRMRLHLFAVACSRLSIPVALVVLGMMLLHVVLMYLTLDVCVLW